MQAGALAMQLVRDDVRPSDIVTRDALENAAAAVAATGGSTNGVLHLIAIARELGIAAHARRLRRDRAADARDRREHQAGRAVRRDRRPRAGGVGLVARELPKRELSTARRANVDGRTLARDRRRRRRRRRARRSSCRSRRRSRRPAGCACSGATSRPRAASSSSPATSGPPPRPRARLRLRGGRASPRSRRTQIQPGDVVVIRYEGPAGGPGMREMLHVTAAIVGEGLGEEVALVTDGRFSGATHGLHGRPRRARGVPRRPDRRAARRRHRRRRRRGARAARRALRRRARGAARATGRRPPPRYTHGVLAKYAALVSSASEGAVTRPPA